MTDPPVIAIVDDDASVRRALRRLMRSAGYAVESFASGREFLDWLPHGRAACVLLDVHLKGITGFELQERLTVPVIFMTSHDDGLTRARIEKSRAADHLWKPFDDHAMLAAIRRVLSGPAE